MDILAQSLHSEDSHSLLEADLENPKKSYIKSNSKNLRVFEEDSEGELVLKPIRDAKKKELGVDNVRIPHASDSEPSQGSAWTMAEEELDDQKLKIKEDFDDLHVKIMALTEQIKGLEQDFYRSANAKAIELEGIGKNEEKQMERHRHLYEIKQLVDLEQRLRRMEFEKIRLIQKEARVTADLAKIARVYGA